MRHGRPPLVLLVAFVGAAFVSTLCGIGGGLFAVPMLHFLGKLPLKESTSTSLVLVFVLATTATISELLHPDSSLQLAAVGALVAGGLIGTRIGFAISQRIDARRLTILFVVALIFAGARVLMPSSAPAAGSVDASVQLDWQGALLVGAIGLAGGIASPLLGIGGGLVMVPALFLLVPGADYLFARASALGAAVANAGLGVALGLRAGRVHPKRAAWFAPAALLGGLLGVQAVHLPGWAEAARILMGVVMLAVALRFFLQLRAGAASADAAGS